MVAGAHRHYDGAAARMRTARGPTPMADDPDLASFVADLRDRRASWAAVARCIGRSEHDTRLAFDPAYRPEPMLIRDAARADARKLVAMGVALGIESGSAGGQRKAARVKPGTFEAEVLARIDMGDRLLDDLIEGLGWTRIRVRGVLMPLKNKGFAEVAETGWRLTAAGRAELFRLRREAMA